MGKLYHVLAIFLVATLLVCIAACSTTGEETTTAKSEITTEKVEETTAEATTEESTTISETEGSVAETESESESAEETTYEETTEEDTNVYEEFVAPDGTVYLRNQWGVIYNDDGSINAYSWHYYPEAVQYNGEVFASVQEAMDAVVQYKKDNPDATPSKLRISIKNDVDYQVANTGVDEDDYSLGPVYVNVPDDGNFYGLYYNWWRCDIRFSIGVTYDDGNTPVPGLAYYSLLEVLDSYTNLDGTHCFIWSNNEGFAPGYYQMNLKPGHDLDSDGDAIPWDVEENGYNYEYVYVGSLDECWHYDSIER